MQNSTETLEAPAPAASTPAKPASLKFILVCVFVDMLGIGLIIPVLPILVGEYVASPELQARWFGVLGAVFGLMQFLCMPALGALSDRFGRRPVLMYSMFGMFLNFLTTAWAPNLACLFIGRVIGGASSASMSVASAFASDVSTPANRAKSFGMVGAAMGLGFICGPMIGGLLGSIDLHLPFYAAAALCAANLAYGYFYVPESLPLDRRAEFSLVKANPFAALWRLASRKDVRELIIVYTLAMFAQATLYTTWVLYSHFRFGWTPRDNGFALFCVGLTSAVVQAGLLGRLIGRFGEVRLALIGLTSGTLAYLFYGLATQGWMMYAIICANILAVAAGPALQGILSKATPANEQGALMGSLASVASLGSVIMPFIGASVLGWATRLPAGDWRIGSSFFICAAMQGLGIAIAWGYFKRHHMAGRA